MRPLSPAAAAATTTAALRSRRRQRQEGGPGRGACRGACRTRSWASCRRDGTCAGPWPRRALRRRICVLYKDGGCGEVEQGRWCRGPEREPRAKAAQAETPGISSGRRGSQRARGGKRGRRGFFLSFLFSLNCGPSLLWGPLPARVGSCSLFPLLFLQKKKEKANTKENVY